mmetsp:Transcript_22756/g.55179  ORF Transcript_22756/g.55179 Transcript_22756/m.55179 type:complete len:109 (+) Transcript_22756:64-390(+)
MADEAKKTEETPGVVHMKVKADKGTGFYIRAAKNFFEPEDKDGNKREPVCVLHISGLGGAINTAVAAASAVEREGLGKIVKAETSYPELTTGSVTRGCARIEITIHHK